MSLWVSGPVFGVQYDFGSSMKLRMKDLDPVLLVNSFHQAKTFTHSP